MRLGVGTALRGMGRDLAGVWRLASLLVAIALVFAVGTHRRNRVWQSSALLWHDIVNKAAARAEIDQRTGREVPRPERGRMYNNLGLQLYYKARDLVEAADVMHSLSGDADKVAAKLGMTPAHMRQRRRELARAIETDRAELVALISDDLVDACRERGVSAERGGWDPFIPAELTFEKALYHRPEYPLTHLNFGLVHQLRASRAARAEERTKHLQRAERCFATAHALDVHYEKAYRYHASVLAQLGRHDEARRMAETALKLHGPDGKDDALTETLRLLVGIAIELEDWDAVLDWSRRYLASGAPAPELALGCFRFSVALEKKQAYAVEERLLRDSIAATGVHGAWLKYRLALTLHHQDRTREALAEIDDLIGKADRPHPDFLSLRETLKTALRTSE